MKANIPPFTVGQKVVYIGQREFNRALIYPPKNSVVELVDINFDFWGMWHYKIKGFEYNDRGQGCWFHFEEFRPLQEQKAPLLTFEKIKEEEKEEVLIMN